MPFTLPCDDLVTHGVVVGWTGSRKTRLLLVLVEETPRANVPVISVDVKGDLANLLLTFPELDAHEFAPWLDARAVCLGGQEIDAAAQEVANDWRQRLAD